MVEPEMAFFDLNDNMDLAERFLKRIFSDVLTRCREDMEFFNQRIDNTAIATLEHIIASSFVRLSYTEAVEILKASGEKFEFPVKWGMDMQSEHEKFLTEKVVKGPVAVINYPRDIKAFYMRQNDDGRTVAAMNLDIEPCVPRDRALECHATNGCRRREHGAGHDRA